eukprot:Skav231568  [mRNA]  locus=scaffold481:188610:192297:- [translate_table: standard]
MLPASTFAGLEMQEKDREAVEEKQQEAASTLKGLRQVPPQGHYPCSLNLRMSQVCLIQEQAEELKRTLQSLQGERDDRAATLAEKERRIEGYKCEPADLSELESEFERQLTEQRALEEKIDSRRQHVAILTQAPKEKASAPSPPGKLSKVKEMRYI